MLPIQYRHTEHMHEGVWFGKKKLINDIYENLDYLQALRSFAHILLKSCFHRFYRNLFFKTRVCWFELLLAKTKFFH